MAMVHRTARVPLRLTRGQRRRCFSALATAGDVWAALIDVNPQTVGALERGDHYPSLDLAFRICDVFGLPVEAVFSRTAFTPLSAELYGRRAEGHDHD